MQLEWISSGTYAYIMTDNEECISVTIIMRTVDISTVRIIVFQRLYTHNL